MKLRGFHPYWRYPLQEAALNDASERGLQLEKAGLLATHYRLAEGERYRYRITLCEAPKGSATRFETALAWQRAGWAQVCQRGKLVYYRTPADGTAKPPKDDAFPAFLKRKRRAIELARIWFLVLSALCIVLGYAADTFMIVRASVLPLAVALVQTLILSKIQKALAYSEK